MQESEPKQNFRHMSCYLRQMVRKTFEMVGDISNCPLLINLSNVKTNFAFYKDPYWRTTALTTFPQEGISRLDNICKDTKRYNHCCSYLWQMWGKELIDNEKMLCFETWYGR